MKKKRPSLPKKKSFYQKQVKVALANCGYIDPESIEEYIATGGYEALGTVLTTLLSADHRNN